MFGTHALLSNSQTNNADIETTEELTSFIAHQLKKTIPQIGKTNVFELAFVRYLKQLDLEKDLTFLTDDVGNTASYRCERGILFLNFKELTPEQLLKMGQVLENYFEGVDVIVEQQQQNAEKYSLTLDVNYFANKLMPSLAAKTIPPKLESPKEPTYADWSVQTAARLSSTQNRRLGF